jgi:hypothetical protein
MSNIHKNNWWQKIEAPLQASLKQIWIPVGLPGHAGEKKVKWQELLDERFGPGYWRLGHYVRGQIISKAEAIREYEHSYRVHLRQHPDIVHFLTTFCGNVYDDNITNVHDDSYDQLHTRLNHYQDISIRRVIAELVDDITWPNVTETTVEEVDLTDLNDGQVYHLPRARGFQRAGDARFFPQSCGGAGV